MTIRLRMPLIGTVFLGLILTTVLGTPAAEAGQLTQEERLLRLEEKVEKLMQLLEEKEEKIQKLERKVEVVPTTGESSQRMTVSPQQELDEMVREAEAQAETKPAERALFSTSVGGSKVRLIDVSAIINVASGGSTAGTEEIERLQLGAHDPRRRGWTFQQLELSLAGAVDPYFTGEAHVIFLEEEVELEEAFATTQSLPWGLQLETGYFLTEFGRINPAHPHSWDWLDQPVINGRMFGGDGMRGPGVRAGWLTPLPWFSELHVGIQDPRGARMASFFGEGLVHVHGDDHGHGGGEHGHEGENHEHEGEEHEHEGEEHEHEGEHHEDEHEEAFGFEEGIGGRPIIARDVRTWEDMVYLLRWVNGFDLTEELSTQIGFTGIYGPNNSGSDGDTWIYGGDVVLKWRPADHKRGWPFVTWQSEFMRRDFDADSFAHDEIHLDADTLHDYGFYTQLLVGLQRPWAAGLRFEYATGSGGSAEEGAFIARSDDPYRDDRYRLSPLLVWKPTEFSRFRLQYNYDWAEHIRGHDEHSVWLGMEFLFGSHPAHGY